MWESSWQDEPVNNQGGLRPGLMKEEKAGCECGEKASQKNEQRKRALKRLGGVGEVYQKAASLQKMGLEQSSLGMA